MNNIKGPLRIALTASTLLAICLGTVQGQEYATDIPASITTPDSVKTRLGTLRFFDGMPDAKTAEAVYDNLDFQRGVRSFLDAIPIASMSGIRKGFREGGVTDMQVVGVHKNLMDSRSLFLTANSTVNYAWSWLGSGRGRKSSGSSRLGERFHLQIRCRHRQGRARQGEGRQISLTAA
ncbi:MAG: hypothetical protein P1V19_17900 [Gimesia sp.]|nr:hypothetical protein [Gimesia sp.]